jgi:hypothetical protein
MAKTSPSQNIGPLMLIAVGVVLIIGIVLWQVLPGSNSQTQTPNANIPYPQISRTTLADAKAALEQNKALFVDVRDLDVFNTGHVTGSLSMPLGEIETRYKELDANRWIILYCT